MKLVNLQLKERGFTNVDALDGSKGMLERAKEKGIYKNYIHALLGAQPIEDVEKGSRRFYKNLSGNLLRKKPYTSSTSWESM